MADELTRRGLTPERVRLWLETCFPAQIRAVLQCRDWQQYGIEELCDIGLRGARGLRPGMKRTRTEQRDARAATESMLRAERQMQDARTRDAAAIQAQEQALLDEFF